MCRLCPENDKRWWIRGSQLSEGQRAWIAGKLADIDRGRDRSKPSFGGLTNLAAAEMLSVSEKSVELARIVRDHGVGFIAHVLDFLDGLCFRDCAEK
jgi:hypothetical protein